MQAIRRGLAYQVVSDLIFILTPTVLCRELLKSLSTGKRCPNAINAACVIVVPLSNAGSAVRIRSMAASLDKFDSENMKVAISSQRNWSSQQSGTHDPEAQKASGVIFKCVGLCVV